MRTWNRGGAPWLLFLLALPVVATAQVEHAGNRASFQVEVSRMVANDRVTAVLAASAEAKDPTRCAAEVNDAMRWALSQARGKAGVSVRSGGYSTQPIHDDEGHLTHWRASQELLLDSSDIESVIGIASALQERLALTSLSFGISPGLRKRTEDALIEEALADFRERADLVRRSLGLASWRVHEVSIGASHALRPVASRSLRALNSMQSAPVAAEPGSSRVVVHVQASIALE